ncbi:hypothetical protein NECAME_08706 [Necator americanus]|uniref:Uncharacterized protein n=1 Tax=Necator americanus TaxID=51031 RepID=W2TIY5_NECAM|nr:hypothetical protein NECAME_08706 [Necator americanus]ETN81121.1 hypothetical protein NECAME_08706 [Necator americanus]
MPASDHCRDVAGNALSRTLHDEWIADNAEVTKVLLGGVHVVGLLWCSDRKYFNDQKLMLTKALGRIQRATNLLTTLSLSSVSDHTALVFNEYPNGKPTVFIVDVVRRGPDSPQKCLFCARMDFGYIERLHKDMLERETRTKQSHFFTEFLASIRPLAENFLNCPLVLINGEMRDDRNNFLRI